MCLSRAVRPESESSSCSERSARIRSSRRCRSARRISGTATPGTGAEFSIRGRAGLIGELTGYDGEMVWDTPKPNGQPRRRLDVSRAEELFGFRAGTPLRDGLERTIAWYRASAAAPATR